MTKATKSCIQCNSTGQLCKDNNNNEHINTEPNKKRRNTSSNSSDWGINGNDSHTTHTRTQNPTNNQKQKQTSIHIVENIYCAVSARKEHTESVHSRRNGEHAVYTHEYAYSDLPVSVQYSTTVHTDGMALKTKNGKIENYESMLQSVNDATSNRADVNLVPHVLFVVVAVVVVIIIVVIVAVVDNRYRHILSSSSLFVLPLFLLSCRSKLRSFWFCLSKITVKWYVN